MVVGCGKSEPLGSGNEYNAGLATTQTTTKANPVKELTAEEKQKALRDSVVGEYEVKEFDGGIIKEVFQENGIRERYYNGEKSTVKKWTIINKEIHIAQEGFTNVWRINTDRSITWIADIEDGKRTPIINQSTLKKIK